MTGIKPVKVYYSQKVMSIKDIGIKFMETHGMPIGAGPFCGIATSKTGYSAKHLLHKW